MNKIIPGHTVIGNKRVEAVKILGNTVNLVDGTTAKCCRAFVMGRDGESPESLIEKFKDRVKWGWISKYQKLSEPFIEKYQDRVNWYNISGFQELSEPFIEKHEK